MNRAEVRHVVYAALFEDRNPLGQDWLCPPDWTGWGFDRVADLVADALAEAGLLNDGPKRPPELSPEERTKRAEGRDRGVLNDGQADG